MPTNSENAMTVVSSESAAVRRRDLASPQDRLFAVLVDGVAGGATALASVAAYYAIGLVSPTLGGLAAAAMMWSFVGYQIYSLAVKGQTIGKSAMKLRIVNETDGANPGFLKAVVLRGFVSNLLNATVLFPLLDLLPIFFGNRRCIHDFIGGTLVVNSDGAGQPRAALTESTSHPLDDLLLQMKHEHAASKESLVNAMVTLRKAQAKEAELAAKAASLKQDAQNSVQRGNEDLARRVLTVSREVQDQLNTHKLHVEQLSRSVAAMKEAVDAEAKKISYAAASKGVLKGRMAQVQVQTNGESAFKAFDETVGKMEESVQDQTDRLEVGAQLSGTSKPVETPEETASSIDSELEKLRQEIEVKRLG